MTLSDEILMAYADGQLDAPEAARIAKLAAQDPALAARLEPFLSTGHNLAALFEGPMHAPLPEKLRRIVERARPLPARKPSLGVMDRLRELLQPVPPLRLALVSATVLASVLAATSAMLQSGAGTASTLGGLVQQAANGQMVARGALEQALNGLPSGKEMQGSLADGGVVRIAVKLSFPDREQAYCRQYGIALAKSYGGVACKLRSSAGSQGQWAIRFQAVEASGHTPSGKAIPAGPEHAELERAVISMMGGDALGPKEEAAAIAAGWKGR
jgi:anti-sigma factor RsiW